MAYDTPINQKPSFPSPQAMTGLDILEENLNKRIDDTNVLLVKVVKNVEDLMRIAESLRGLGSLSKSDRFTFEKLIQILDGQNIQLATGTGTQIGTAVGQKLGVYGATPIVQRSGSAQATVSGTADATYSANEVTLINDIVTLVNELRTAMVNFGIIKGSA